MVDGVTFEVVAEGLRFPEGPVCLTDGTLLVCEIERGTLSRVDPTDGSIEVVADLGGGPNGAAIGPDGAAYVANNGECFEFIDVGMLIPGPVPASYRGGSIQRVDLGTGEVATLYTECDGRPLRAPNDLVFDAAGGMYVTDHGLRLERTTDRGSVYYAAPDGGSIAEVVFPLDSPNGVGLSPDGTQLYAVETYTSRMWAWAVNGPGDVASTPHLFAGGRCLYGAPGLRMFDSLAVDGDGWICVATLGEGGITAVSPDGSQVEFHAIPDDPVVTNICFVGADSHTAYVTSSATGRLLRCEWPRPGRALAFGA